MTSEDREQYIKDNAVALVTRLEAKCERYREIVKRLENSRTAMRRLLVETTEDRQLLY